MKRHVLALALVALVPLLVIGCGNKLPKGAIAVVYGQPITQTQFDQWVASIKLQYASQKTPFPAENTADFNKLKAQIVDYLVTSAIVTKKAADMKITVTDAEIAQRMTQQETQAGGPKKLDALLAKQGMTRDQLNQQFKIQILGQKIQAEVLKGVTITDKQVQDYYNAPENQKMFLRPVTRDVRHVLLKTQAEALKVRALLIANNTDANWKVVAAKYSIDPGSKDKGGAYPATAQGQMVPQFDKFTFSTKVGVISPPVHTKDGWHIIEVTAINPAGVAPFDQVKQYIQQTMQSAAQSTAIKNWLDQAKKDAKIIYAPGYDPAKLTASPTPATAPTLTPATTPTNAPSSSPASSPK
jgi:parvulin-like peptidyl-prolyl isomerase